MAQYKVIWEIDVSGSDPFDAALYVQQDVQRNHESEANVFTVIDNETGKVYEVDLDEPVANATKEIEITKTDDNHIIVEVQGGNAFCNDPRVHIIDYDNLKSGDTED